MNYFRNLDIIFLILLSSIILSVLLSWISIKIAPRIGLMDIPGSAKHKKHRLAIPLTGGIVLLDTLLIMLIITGFWKNNLVFALCFSSFIIGILGIIDDYISLKPILKFAGQIFASVVIIHLGIKVELFNSPEFFFRTETQLDNYLNHFITILWLTTVTNAFNFIDSSDGLAVGLCGVSSAFFIFISMNTHQEIILVLCTIILGICIGLYFFNSHPAKLFLGDSGAQTLGFFLASIAILYNPKTGTQSSTWFVPIMIFYVPLFDLLLVIFSRLKRGKEIYKASQDHTYHRLSIRGISIHHSVLIMHGISLVMSMIGYLCLNLSVLYANIVFCLTILLAIAIFFELDNNFS